MRPVDDPQRVAVAIDLDTATEAAAFQNRVRGMWQEHADTVLNPSARIVEVVETPAY